MIQNKQIIYTNSGTRLTEFCANDNNINLILVPAPGLGSESLLKLADAILLKSKYNIWLFDYPGDGSNRDNKYDFVNWKNSLIEAAASMNKPIVIGHSTGGMYVQSIPELESLLSGLVLLATAPDMSWKDEFNRYLQKHITPDIEDKVNSYELNPSDETLRSLLIVMADFSFKNKSLPNAIDMLKTLPVNSQIAQYSDTSFDPVYTAKFIPHMLPTLIITGDNDKIIPLKVWTDNPSYNRKNIQIKSIPNASHYPWFENPEEICESITEFINANRL